MGDKLVSEYHAAQGVAESVRKEERTRQLLQIQEQKRKRRLSHSANNSTFGELTTSQKEETAPPPTVLQMQLFKALQATALDSAAGGVTAAADASTERCGPATKS